ncbi:alcohol oxidase [Salix suchowensis]|nr:alcohol oxidase [Salix suchowensis]
MELEGATKYFVKVNYINRTLDPVRFTRCNSRGARVLQSESFSASKQDLDKYSVRPDAEYHGTEGPIKRIYPPWNGGNMYGKYYSALHSLGVPSNPIICQGEGVEYIKDKVTHKVTAREKLFSQQLLELSGIGDEAILKRLGIPVTVNLPGVGANLLIDSSADPSFQDHISTMYTAEMDQQYESMDRLGDPAEAGKEMELYQTKKEGIFASTPSIAYAFLPLRYFSDVDIISRKASAQIQANKGALPGTTKILQKQQEWLSSDKDRASFGLLPCEGAVPEPGKKYFSIFLGLLHPLSLGSVHISSTDPLAPPAIDLNVLSNDVDLDIMVDAVKYARKVVSTDALKDVVRAEVSPGASVNTDEGIKAYIKDNLATVFHPVGTAAMLSRADGGVVDETLKVYGTQNLRVVSVMYQWEVKLLINMPDRLTRLSFLSNSRHISKQLCTLLLRRYVSAKPSSLALTWNRVGCGYHQSSA